MFIQLILGCSFALNAVLYDLFQFDLGQLGDTIGALRVLMVGCMRNYFFIVSYPTKTRQLTPYYFVTN